MHTFLILKIKREFFTEMRKKLIYFILYNLLSKCKIISAFYYCAEKEP